MPTAFSEIIKSNTPTLVDFSAEWCGPCKMMKPVLQELKSRMGDKTKIIKVDIDQSPQAANAYSIRSVPTLILFRSGEIKWRQSGVVSAEYLQQIISQHSS
jgi:thioredoxin 1